MKIFILILNFVFIAMTWAAGPDDGDVRAKQIIINSDHSVTVVAPQIYYKKIFRDFSSPSPLMIYFDDAVLEDRLCRYISNKLSLNLKDASHIKILDSQECWGRYNVMLEYDKPVRDPGRSLGGCAVIIDSITCIGQLN